MAKPETLIRSTVLDLNNTAALIVSASMLNPELWHTNHVEPPPFDPIGLDAAADTAFPKRGADLKKAFAAAVAFHEVHERFHSDPWPHPFPWDEEAKAAAAPRMAEAETAVRDFLDAVAAVADLE